MADLVLPCLLSPLLVSSPFSGHEIARISGIPYERLINGARCTCLSSPFLLAFFLKWFFLASGGPMPTTAAPEAQAQSAPAGGAAAAPAKEEKKGPPPKKEIVRLFATTLQVHALISSLIGCR